MGKSSENCGFRRLEADGLLLGDGAPFSVSPAGAVYTLPFDVMAGAATVTRCSAQISLVAAHAGAPWQTLAVSRGTLELTENLFSVLEAIHSQTSLGGVSRLSDLIWIARELQFRK